MDKTNGKKIILSEINQTQKDKYGILFGYMWTLAIKKIITKLHSVDPEKLEIEGLSSRDTWI